MKLKNDKIEFEIGDIVLVALILTIWLMMGIDTSILLEILSYIK